MGATVKVRLEGKTEPGIATRIKRWYRHEWAYLKGSPNQGTHKALPEAADEKKWWDQSL